MPATSTKVKKIWSADTAAKVAAAKSAKYGEPFTVVPMAGGGFAVEAVSMAMEIGAVFAQEMP